jgi:hypothetical protein
MVLGAKDALNHSFDFSDFVGCDFATIKEIPVFRR